MTPRVAIVLFLAGCVAQPSLASVAPDPEEFERHVYPILLADCGYPACHGTTARFFAVFGPGRTRLSERSGPYDPPTAEELALSFARAEAMLLDPAGPRNSPLVRRPLTVSAGGAAHRGDDPWGAPVYATKRDPRWQALFFWAAASEVTP